MKAIKTLLAVAVSGAPVVTLPASASTAQASLTNLTFTLVDLDVNDGIEPSFEVLAGKGRRQATLLGRDWLRYAGTPLVRTSTPFASLSSGLIGGNYRATGASFAVAQADGIGRDALAGARSLNAYACNNCRLILSANTRLIVSGDYSIAAQDIEDPRSNPYWADGPARASVEIFAARGHTVFGDIDESLSTTRDQTAESFSRSGSFSFDIDNDLDRTRGNTFLSFSAHATAYGAAVPEPSTYAMMLGGLAMIGFVVRRRRKAGKGAGTGTPRG